jgi:membrane-associated protease RseP (regulator of RpoE activity)
MLRKVCHAYLFFCLLVVIGGCATTGPEIPQEELKAVEKEIEGLAAELYVTDLVRIWKIEYQILKSLPPGEFSKEKEGIGALIEEDSKKVARAFGLKEGDGCVVVGVVEGGPAHLAGLQPGDLIRCIDSKEVEGLEDIEFTEGRSTKIIVEREGGELAFWVIPEKIPHITIRLKETDKVNAFAKFSGIEVTRGLLRFVENDDELAVIIGHEIAHLTNKHLPKNMTVAGLCGLVGGLTGPFAAPVTQALYAPYSRETEREADYFGLLYAQRAGYDIEKGAELWKRFAIELPNSLPGFLRTHPATPERILRVKKVVEILKDGHEEWGSTAKGAGGE